MQARLATNNVFFWGAESLRKLSHSIPRLLGANSSFSIFYWAFIRPLLLKFFKCDYLILLRTHKHVHGLKDGQGDGVQCSNLDWKSTEYNNMQVFCMHALVFGSLRMLQNGLLLVWQWNIWFKFTQIANIQETLAKISMHTHIFMCVNKYLCLWANFDCAKLHCINFAFVCIAYSPWEKHSTLLAYFFALINPFAIFSLC